MSNPKIVAVVPSIRPEQMAKFREAWAPLFERHGITLLTVWDGENPFVEERAPNGGLVHNDDPYSYLACRDSARDLFVRRSDACRNLGFVAAAVMGADFVLTLDDDCLLPDNIPIVAYPVRGQVFATEIGHDPIQAHLDALARRVPVSWMNTAHAGAEYLRGVPYGVRDEAPVMLSHGVWVGVPDFDGETQLRLERSGGLPRTLPYYVGPVSGGVLWPCCGMNLMVRREGLPYLYFAPMGPDSGVEGLHRFADIWMGLALRQEFTRRGWAIYTGASTILHTRASDAAKNFEQEKLGRAWNEVLWKLECGVPFPDPIPPGLYDYWEAWKDKRGRFAALIRSIQGASRDQDHDRR